MRRLSALRPRTPLAAATSLRKPRPLSHSLSCFKSAAAVCAALLAAGAAAQAQDTWNGGTDLSWDTGANWSTGLAPLATDAVTFKLGAGSTITLGATEVALSLNFLDNYTLTGGSLSLGAGGNISVGAGVTGSIASVLTGSNGLTYNGNGTGTLVLSGVNTYSGGTTLSSGTLAINNAAALGAVASNTFTITGGAIDNTSGAAITTGNYVQAWNGDFAFGGTNALNLGTGAVTLNAARTVTTNGTAALTVGGNITGSGFGLTKAGNGTLVLNGVVGTGAGTVTVNGGTLTLGGTNTYTGVTTINSGGTLKLGVAGGVGQTASITVNSGGTLDINGLNGLGTKTLTISGAGVANHGAYYNSSTTDQTQGVQNLVLAANATVGGAGRLDLRGTATLNMGGFQLTTAMTGGKYFALVGATVSNPGSILVSTGGFSIETGTNLAGSATNTITVNNGAFINYYNVSGDAWTHIMQGGSKIQTNNGAATDNITGAWTLNGAVTVAPQGGDTLVLSGAISGTGALTMTGAGTFTLTGTANSYNGMTVNSGTVNLNSAQAAGTGAVSVTGGTLNANIAGGLGTANVTQSGGIFNANVANALSGSQTLTISGGTFVANNTTGSATGLIGVLLNGGMLASGVTGEIDGTVTAGGATANVVAPGGLLSAGTLTLGALNTTSLTTLNFDVATPWSTTPSNTGDLLMVSGNGALNIASGTSLGFVAAPSAAGNYRLIGYTGAAPLLSNFVLPGTPDRTTYTLSTAIDPGFVDLVVANTGANITSTWSVAGGGSWNSPFNWDLGIIPSISGDSAILGNIIGTSNATITLDASQRLGTLSFNNTTATPGNYTIASGTGTNTLVLDNFNNNAPALVTNAFGANVISAQVNLFSNANFDIATGSSLNISGSISGPSSMTVLGTSGGTLTLSGTNTFTGGLFINGGTVVDPSTSMANLGGGTANVTINGGTLSFTANSATNNVALTGEVFTIGPAGGTINTTGTTGSTSGKLLLSKAGNLAGSGTLTKTGGGDLQISAANTGFTGNVVINGGEIELQSAAGLGSVGTITIASGGELVGSLGGGTIPNPLVITGTGILSANANNTIFSGSLNVPASGTFTLAARQFQTVTTGSAFSVIGNISGGASLALSTSQTGQGTVTLGGNNINWTTTQGSTLAQAFTLGNFQGLQFESTPTTNSRPGGASGVFVTFNGASTPTLGLLTDGDGFGTPNVAATYSDTLTFTTGGTIVVGRAGLGVPVGSGLLLQAANKTIVETNGFSLGGATLSVTNNNNYGLLFQGTINLSSSPTFSVATATTSNLAPGLTLSGQVLGTGFTKAGAGTMVLSNASNGFTGTITITNGVLGATSDGALGTGTNGITLNGAPATFEAFDNITTGRTFTFSNTTASNNVLAAASGKTLTITSALSGANGFTKTDPGTLVLSGSSGSYTGAFTASGGATRITTSTALGTGAITVANNQGTALLLDGTSGALTLANTLNISSSGINTGGSIENFAGSNTLNGAITLGNGATIGADNGTTLNIKGGISGAQALTFAGAGNIAISNTAIGAVSSITKLGAGTTTLGIASPLYVTALAVNGGTFLINGAATLGTAAVANTVTSGATLKIDNSTATANRLGTSRTMTLAAGTFEYAAGASASSESTGALSANAGADNILVDTTSSATTLTFASLVVNGGSTLLFNAGGTNAAFGSAGNKVVFTTAPALSSPSIGILPRGIVIDSAGISFATYNNTGLAANTNGVQALASYNIPTISSVTVAGTAVTVADTSVLSVGMAVYGPNIPAGDTIAAITGPTTYTLTTAATAAATSNLAYGATSYTDINSLVAVRASGDNVKLGTGFVTDGNAINAPIRSFGSINMSGAGQTLDSVVPNGSATLTLASGNFLSSGAGTNTIGGGTIIAAGGTEIGLTVASGNTLVVNGAFSGSGAITKGLTGNVTFNAAQYFNTGGNNFTINGGTVTLNGGTNTLFPGVQGGAGSGYVGVGIGATLDLNGNSQMIGSLRSPNSNGFAGSGGTVTTSTGAATLVDTGGQGDNFGGQITGNIFFAKSGANGLNLYSNNTFSGGLSLMGGTTTLLDSGKFSGLTSSTPININSASLVISNTGTMNDNDRISDAAPINFRAGSITYNGRAQTASTETLGTLTLLQGASEITVNGGGTGINSAELTFASLVQGSMDATLNIHSYGQAGSNPRLLLTTAPTLTNNILSPAIESGATDWATYIPGLGLTALNAVGAPGYDGAAFPAVNQPTQNIKLAAAGAIPSGGLTLNTLNVTGVAVTYTNSSDVLNLAAGGLMHTGATSSVGATVDSGVLTAGGASASGTVPLYIDNGAGAFTINSRIADPNASSHLRLILTTYNGGNSVSLTDGANSYTGGTVVNGWIGNAGVGLTLNGAAGAVVVPAGGLTLTNGIVTEVTNGGQINSSNVVTLNGSSTLTLVGANTLDSLIFNNNGGTGSPTVASGTGVLSLSNSTPISVTASNASTVPVISGTLDFANAAKTIAVDATTVNGVAIAPLTAGLNLTALVQNSGQITKTGSGNLQLSNVTNAFSGGVNLSQGGLIIGGSSTPSAVGLAPQFGPLGTGTLTVGSGTSLLSTAANTISNAVSIQGDFTFNGINNLTLNGATSLPSNVNTNITVAAPQMTATLGAVVSGAGSKITKNGLGTLTLANTNTFTGGVTLNAGTIVATGSVPFGTGTVTLNGGLLQLRSNTGGNYGNALTITPSLTNAFIDINGNTAGLGTSIFAFGTLTEQATTVLNVTGGTGFKVQFTGTNLTSLGTPASFNPAAGTTIILPGGFNDANRPVNIGLGTLAFSGNNTFTTGTTITGTQTIAPQANSISTPLGTGTLTLANGSTLQVTPIFGTLSSAGYTQGGLAGHFNQYAAGTALNSVSTSGIISAGVIGGMNVGDGSITNHPAGVMASGSQPTLDTEVYNGLLSITNAGAYNFEFNADDEAELVIDGAVVHLRDNTGGAGGFNAGFITGSIALSAGMHSIVIRHQNGTGGSGIPMLYNGPDTLAAGTLSPGWQSIANNSTYYTVGVGSAANNYLNAAQVNNSVVVGPGNTATVDGVGSEFNSLFASLTLGAGSTLIVNNQTGSGFIGSLGAATVAANATVQPNSGTLYLAGGVNDGGSNGLIKIGQGALILGNSGGTFGGSFAIKNGYVQIAGANALTTGTTTVGDTVGNTGATLDLNGFSHVLGTLILNGSGPNTTTTAVPAALYNSSATAASFDGNIAIGAVVNAKTPSIGGYGDIALNGVISDNVSGQAWSKVGPDTVSLNGANNFSGALTVAAGVLKLGNVDALGQSLNGLTVSSGATLDLNGISPNANRTLTIGGTGVTGLAMPNTLGALINSSTTIDVTYSGPVVLSSTAGIGSNTLGVNSYTFGLNAGQLSGLFPLTPQPGDITLSAGISGGQAFTKVGSNTLFLTGAQSNSGTPDTIALGQVVLEGNGAMTGATAFVINSGGTLTLDNSQTNVSNRLSGHSLTINGDFNITGNSFNATTEALSAGGVTAAFTNSGSVVTLLADPGEPLVVNVTSNTAFTYTVGATTLIRGNNLGGSAISGALAGYTYFSDGSQANPGFIGQTATSGANAGILPWALVDTSATGNGISFAAYNTANGVQTLGQMASFVTTLTANDNIIPIADVTAAAGTTSINSLTLNGVNANINSGSTLMIQSGGILAIGNEMISGSGVINQGATNTIIHTPNPNGGGTTTLTLATPISGTGALVKADGGTLQLATAMQYTGNTFVDGGTLQLAAGSNTLLTTVATSPAVGAQGTAISGQVMQVNLGGTLDLNGNNQTLANLNSAATLPGLGGTVTNSSTTRSNLVVALSANQTFAGSITGNLNFQRHGGFAYTLESPNTYTGSTVFEGGNTILQDQATLQNTSGITITKAALQWNDNNLQALANRLGTAPITLNGGAFVYNARSGTQSAISIGNVTLGTGSSVLQVNPLNGSASVTIGTGTGASLSRTALSGSTITFNSNSTNAGGASALLGGNGVGDAARIFFATAPTLTNGMIGGWATAFQVYGGFNTQVAQPGFATYTASGISNINANLTTLATGNVPAGVNALATGNLTLPAGGVTLNSLSMFTAGSTISFANASDTLNIQSGGILSGVDANARTIGAAANSGVLTAGGTYTAGSQPAGVELFIHNAASTFTVNSVIADNKTAGAANTVPLTLVLDALSQSGPIIALTAANTYTGTTYVNGVNVNLNAATGPSIPGTLVIGGGTSNGTDSQNPGNSTVKFLQSNQIAPTASVTVGGGSILDLNGFSNTIGNLTLNSDGGSFSNIGPVVQTGVGVLTLSGSITSMETNDVAIPVMNGNLSLASGVHNATVGVNPNLPSQVGLQINSAMTGTGSLNVVSGIIGFGGVSTVPVNLGASATINVGSFTPTIGTLTGTGTVTGNATGQLSVGNDNANGTFNGTLTGPVTIAKVGTGNFTLAGSASNFTGNVNVLAGTLTLAGGIGVTPTGNGALNVFNGGTLTGSASVPGGIALNYGSALSFASSSLGANPFFDFGGVGTLSDNGPAQVNITGAAPAVGVYPLIAYTGNALTASQLAGLHVGSVPSGSGLLYGILNDGANKQVSLSVETVNPTVTWTGANGGTWDTSSVNFANAGNNPVAFTSGNQVVFDNTGLVKTITGSTPVNPQAITVTNSGSTNNYAISTPIVGTLAGGLTKNGNAVLQLTGNNTFTGPITVNGGTLRASATSAGSGVGSGAITLNGTTLQFDPLASTSTNGLTARKGATAASPVTSINFSTATSVSTFFGTGNATYTSAAPESYQFTGKISITNPGTYAFFSNSDDGSRIYIDGVLVDSSDGGKGANETGGTINLSAGLHDIRVDYANSSGGGSETLNYQGPGQATKVAIPASMLFTAETASLTGSSTLVNVGSNVAVNGSSTINLNGNNFTGVQLGSLTIAPGGTLNALGLVGKQLRSNYTAFTGGSTDTINAVADVALGQVSDGGNAVTIAKTGSGRLVFDNAGSGGAASSFVSGSLIDIQAGDVVLQGINGGTNPIGAAGLKLDGGNLLFDSRFGGVTFDNGLTVAQDGILKVQTDAQTLVLGSAVNGVSIASGKTLTIDTFGGNRSTSPGGTVVAVGATLSINGVISGSGNLAIQSSQYNAEHYPVPGTVVLTAANTVTGSTTINGVFTSAANPENLLLQGSGSLATTSGIVVNSGQLTLDDSGTNLGSRLGATASAVPVTLNGSVLQFTANTGSNVNTTENVGTLALGGGFNQIRGVNVGTGTTSVDTFNIKSLARQNNATLAFFGTTLGNAATLADGFKFGTAPTLSGGGGAAASPTISILPYAIGQSGTGAWGLVTYDTNGIRTLATGNEYLTSANNGAGTTNNVRDSVGVSSAITGGTFNAYVYDNTGNAANTGTLTTAINLGGSTGIGALLLTNTNGTQTVTTISGTGGSFNFGSNEGVITVTGTAGAVINVPVNGSGGLTVGGFGPLTLGSTSNTLTGTVTINGSELLIAGAGSLGTTSTIQIGGGSQASGGTVTAGSGFVKFNGAGISLAQNVILEAGSFGGFDTAANSGTVSGAITGSGSLVKIGANTLTLTGIGNTYTGQTQIYAGTLQASTAALPQQAGASILNNAALTFSQGTDGIYSGSINGIGSVTVTGSGGTPTISFGGTNAGAFDPTNATAGANSYTGGTTVSASTTLQGTTTSLQGNIALSTANTSQLTFNQSFSGLFQGVITGPGQVNLNGSGTVIFGSANTYTGTTNVNAGKLVVQNSPSLTSINTLAATAITVAAGATFAPNYAANAPTTNINVGTTGAGSTGATLTLQPGSVFDMTDSTNTIKTFNLNQQASFAGVGLTIGGASGAAPQLKFSLGASAGQIDTINVASAVSVGATGAAINIVPLSTDASLTPGDYIFMTAPSGLGSGFTLANSMIGVNGIGYTLSLIDSSPTNEVLTVGQIPAPANAYWTGVQNSIWSTLTSAAATNWSTSPAGTTDTNQVPSASSNVFFTANTASNLTTTLGANETINSLNFTGTGTPASGGVTISGNTLTINGTNANGNAAGNGINVAAGTGAVTIASNVVLGGSQTWTNASTQFLTVSGAISGAGSSLTTAGSGTIVVSGTATYTGQTNVTSGTLIVSGALSGTTGTNVSANAMLFDNGTIAGTATVRGTLAGSGTIAGPVAATGGTIAPGGFNGLGTLSVTNSLNLDSNSIFSVALGGKAVGQFSRVSANGINLNSDSGAGAHLQLSLVNGYTPVPGDFLVIGLNGGTESGLFANTTPDSNPSFFGGATFRSITVGGFEFAVSYNSTASTFINGGVGGGSDIALLAVPEPNTAATLVAGLGAMAGLQTFRRRRSK